MARTVPGTRVPYSWCANYLVPCTVLNSYARTCWGAKKHHDLTAGVKMSMYSLILPPVQPVLIDPYSVLFHTTRYRTRYQVPVYWFVQSSFRRKRRPREMRRILHTFTVTQSRYVSWYQVPVPWHTWYQYQAPVGVATQEVPHFLHILALEYPYMVHSEYRYMEYQVPGTGSLPEIIWFTVHTL